MRGQCDGSYCNVLWHNCKTIFKHRHFPGIKKNEVEAVEEKIAL
jgi:hypothetical protein